MALPSAGCQHLIIRNKSNTSDYHIILFKTLNRVLQFCIVWTPQDGAIWIHTTCLKKLHFLRLMMLQILNINQLNYLRFSQGFELNRCNNKTRQWTDLRLSSTQFWLSIPTDSSFTPESFKLFELRFSSLRWDRLDFRAEATISQWVSESPQSESLSWHKMILWKKTLYIYVMCMMSSSLKNSLLINIFYLHQWFNKPSYLCMIFYVLF